MTRILIADDDELIAELTSEVLIDAGHACGWVTTAEDAWRCVHRKRPDILLLDQSMPGESGMTLLRRLRGSAQFYDLPVIMFTAMNGEQDELQAIYAAPLAAAAATGCELPKMRMLHQALRFLDAG